MRKSSTTCIIERIKHKTQEVLYLSAWLYLSVCISLASLSGTPDPLLFLRCFQLLKFYGEGVY